MVPAERGGRECIGSSTLEPLFCCTVCWRASVGPRPLPSMFSFITLRIRCDVFFFWLSRSTMFHCRIWYKASRRVSTDKLYLA